MKSEGHAFAHEPKKSFKATGLYFQILPRILRKDRSCIIPAIANRLAGLAEDPHHIRMGNYVATRDEKSKLTSRPVWII